MLDFKFNQFSSMTQNTKFLNFLALAIHWNGFPHCQNKFTKYDEMNIISKIKKTLGGCNFNVSYTYKLKIKILI